jgi:hypothetical protein
MRARVMKKPGVFAFNEHRPCLDDVRFDSARYAHDLANTPATVAVNPEMNDQVHAGSDRWCNEASADVLTGEHVIGRVQAPAR